MAFPEGQRFLAFLQQQSSIALVDFSVERYISRPLIYLKEYHYDPCRVQGVRKNETNQDMLNSSSI